MKKCSFKKANGERCKANARPGRTRCAFHDEELSERRAAGRRAGGRSRSGQLKPAVLPIDTPDARLDTVADVAAFVGGTLNLVRTGKVAVAVANAVFVGCGVMLKALELGKLADQLDQLEAQTNRRTA